MDRFLFVLLISFFISPLLSDAGEVYLWTDDEGVVNITDNRRKIPPESDVEKIPYRERGGDKALPESPQPKEFEQGSEKKEAAYNAAIPAEDPSRREIEGKTLKAREEYDVAADKVERQRRRLAHKNTRQNRDRYNLALKELAEKRELLRALEGQK